MNIDRHPPAGLSFLVWGLGAALYFTAFYHRVAPAVMTDQLMIDFHIGAAALCNFSAFYFYSYSSMQIPSGILADLWGPRKLLAAGSFIAAIGTLLFAGAPNIHLANIGRLLIGGSVAVAYVALLKLSICWFPADRYATMGGLALLVGVIGAVSAGVPLRYTVDSFGWRPVMLILAVVLLGISAAIWLIVRDDPSEKGYASFAPSGAPSDSWSLVSSLSGLRSVLSFKNTWLLSLTPSGMVGPVLAFAGLWGVPFFTTHYCLSPAQSAALTSTLMVAWAIGGPVLGALSDKVGRRRPIYLAGSITACIGWTIVLYAPRLPLYALIPVIIILGFAAGAIIIGFAFAKESVDPSLSGTVSGVINMGIMIGPVILQPAMGLILEKSWQGVIENGVRIYSLVAYRSAFTLIIAWAALSVLLIFFTKETYCRQISGKGNLALSPGPDSD